MRLWRPHRSKVAPSPPQRSPDAAQAPVSTSTKPQKQRAPQTPAEQNDNDGSRKAVLDPYQIKQVAFVTKAFLQMSIGIYVVWILLNRLIGFAADGEDQCVAGPTTTTPIVRTTPSTTQPVLPPTQTTALEQQPLFCYPLPHAEATFHLIADALAAAALIELAYTLFTPGPDEALNPIMLGLAAALLLQIARVDELDPQEAGAALLYVLGLGGLFGLKSLLDWNERRRSKPLIDKEKRRQVVLNIWSVVLWILAMGGLAGYLWVRTKSK
jgi:hypothetical protein